MSRRALGAFAAVGLVVVVLPSLRAALDLPVFYLVFGYFIAFWVTQATSWNILSGYTGYFSFGQAAFYGTGVYTSALLVNRFDVGYFLTIPLAGLAALLLGLVVGGLAFRLGSLRGDVFALLTLAVAFVLAAVARVSAFVDGGQGQAVAVPEYPAALGDVPDLVFRLGGLLAVAAVAAAYAIQHSRFGWGLFAIRDEEQVAAGLGVPTLRYKLLAIGGSSALAGASGAVHSLQIGYVTIDDVFAVAVPLSVILMCVLGGRHHWLGPVLGAVVVFTLQDRLSSAGFERWSQIVLGATLVGLILFAPDGLSARLRRAAPAAAGSFAVVFAVLAATGVGGGLIDWFAGALLAGTLVLFVPRRRRPQRQEHHGPEPEQPPQREPEEAANPASGAAR